MSVGMFFMSPRCIHHRVATTFKNAFWRPSL